MEGELAALDGQGSVLVADGAKGAAVGAGLLGSQGLGLLLQEGGEGALGQATRGGSSDLLQGLKVARGAGARLAEDATGDDFSPAGGQVMDLLELLSRGGTLRHGQSCLVLARTSGDAFLLSFYGAVLCPAKCVLASFFGKRSPLPSARGTISLVSPMNPPTKLIPP
jgi:hypothetical protein